MRALRLSVAGAVVLGAAVPALALAASPTVTTGRATHVGQTGAVLTGVVDPGGAPTGYNFSWGPTSALGAATASERAGHGSKPVAVRQRLGGLVPGTTYYYRLGALSKRGGATGAVRSFKTAGPPPPGAVTGPATAVGPTSATINGTVTTNGAATTWQVQYGVTTSYGLDTNLQTIANSTTPVPVSAALSGLAPLTWFHYRIVAFHDGKFAGAGADGTVLTMPAKPLSPNLRTKTTPKGDAKKPFTFETFGSLTGNANIPANLRCTGQAAINYFSHKTRVAHLIAPVQPNCTLAATAVFHHTHGTGKVPIKVTIEFEGNGYIGSTKKTDHVEVGHKPTSHHHHH